jgi:hypothetical protein
MVHCGQCYLAGSILSRLQFIEAQLPYRYEPVHPMPPFGLTGPTLLEQLDDALQKVSTPSHVYLLEGHPWRRETADGHEVLAPINNDNEDDGS